MPSKSTVVWHLIAEYVSKTKLAPGIHPPLLTGKLLQQIPTTVQASEKVMHAYEVQKCWVVLFACLFPSAVSQKDRIILPDL